MHWAYQLVAEHFSGIDLIKDFILDSGSTYGAAYWRNETKTAAQLDEKLSLKEHCLAKNLSVDSQDQGPSYRIERRATLIFEKAVKDDQELSEEEELKEDEESKEEVDEGDLI